MQTDLQTVLRRLHGRINDVAPHLPLDEAAERAAGENRGVRIWCAFTAAEIVILRAAIAALQEQQR